MSNENSNQVDNRSASQRLTDLENAVSQVYNTLDLVTRDLSLLKSATKLLDNKLNSLIKATVAGETVSDVVIDRIMVENNVSDLANKVANMVVNGIVAPEDQVSENSFIVGNESEDDGKVVNPRIQFALKAVAPEIQAKLVGAKPGDSIKFKEGTLSFKILESYKIQDAPQDASQVAEEVAPAVAEQAQTTAEQPTTPQSNFDGL
jgi:hypothetical protein